MNNTNIVTIDRVRGRRVAQNIFVARIWKQAYYVSTIKILLHISE